MNDESLKKRLRTLEVPPLDPEASARALHRATVTLANRDMKGDILSKRQFSGIAALWVAAVATVAACCAMALFLPKQPKSSTVPLPGIAAEDTAAIILREISALFPGQIQSIQRDASGLQLSLAESPDVVSGQAVVLEIQKNGDSQEIITFSGQTIDIMGKSATIHANADGEILIKGAGIEWWSKKPTPVLPHLKIRARII